jgi:hypothetical protein
MQEGISNQAAHTMHSWMAYGEFSAIIGNIASLEPAIM